MNRNMCDSFGFIALSAVYCGPSIHMFSITPDGIQLIMLLELSGPDLEQKHSLKPTGWQSCCSACSR